MFRTSTGFISLDSHNCLSRAQLLPTKHLVTPLSSSALTSIVLTGPWTQTGIWTSCSIVMVLLSSTGKPTSRSLAGLSKSLDAKEGNFCLLISTWELSTPLLMSGAKPLLETPIDGTHQQTDPTLYSAYTDLYSTTDSTARYLLLQNLLRLYMSTIPFPVVCSKSLDSVVNPCCTHWQQTNLTLYKDTKLCIAFHTISYCQRKMRQQEQDH